MESVENSNLSVTGEMVSPRVFVEIGPGRLPAYLGREEIYQGTTYIGVDTDGSFLQQPLREATSQFSRVERLQGTIEDIALNPNTVDEVYIANVFAQTYIDERHKNFEDIEKNPNSKFMRLIKSLDTVHSILKPSGKLSVVETNTPTKLNLLAKIISAKGFFIEQIIMPSKAQDKNWADFKKAYCIGLTMTWPGEDGPYAIIAKPVK